MSLNGACLSTVTTSPLVLKVTQFDLLETFDNTDMHCLMTRICLRNVSLGDFIVVRTCTYTNVDSTV
jgi:hypothetical protein